LDNNERIGIEKKDERNEERISPPTKQEIERCVRKIKNNRAPGEDNVVAEFIKYGGTDITDAIHKLINIIWELECMPECWKTGIICPILKKEDKLVCENYRGITLLNVAYKILSRVLNEKLKEYAEKNLGEYQCGFRPNRSTTDQIFIIRQMLENILNMAMSYICFL
jgi:sorting nexin-29